MMQWISLANSGNESSYFLVPFIITLLMMTGNPYKVTGNYITSLIINLILKSAVSPSLSATS